MGAPRGIGDSPQGGDEGGVWIATGIVCGILLYAFIVLMAVAGFTAVAPLVVVPPVLLGLIGANSLLGGPRRPSPAPRRPVADGPGAPSPRVNGTVAEEPPEPR